jgi:cobalt/nickel transport protein
MTMTKKLWIGVGVLILLSPLGVILPALFDAKGAWGEWGLEEIKKVAGFVPDGMTRLNNIWKAPLLDYGLPGQGKGLMSESFGYMITALIGVAFAFGIMYLLTKLLIRKK